MSITKSPIEPMEAKLVDALPKDDGWQFEPKWDGFRCIAVRRGADVALFAKSGKVLHRYFPEIVAALGDLKADNFVLDGELIVPNEQRVDFDVLQQRLHPADSRITKLSVETPALLVLFDALEVGGKALTDEPLNKRRTALDAFVKANPSPILRLSPFTLKAEEAEHWLSHGASSLDGVVAKRVDGAYQPGVRAMLKVKNIRTADCVVGGFRYGTGSKTVASLLLGLYDDAGKLHHIGFTSGLSKEDKPALTKKLEHLKGEGFTGNAPGGPSRWATERSAEWVPLKPELVVEVSYDHVSGGRFRHGTGLVRWRPDKSPKQCTLEQISPAAAAPIVGKVLAG
ncbi:MAG: ATP-dependent DNA ligase [Devosia sp.]